MGRIVNNLYWILRIMRLLSLHDSRSYLPIRLYNFISYFAGSAVDSHYSLYSRSERFSSYCSLFSIQTNLESSLSCQTQLHWVASTRYLIRQFISSARTSSICGNVRIASLRLLLFPFVYSTRVHEIGKLVWVAFHDSRSHGDSLWERYLPRENHPPLQLADVSSWYLFPDGSVISVFPDDLGKWTVCDQQEDLFDNHIISQGGMGALVDVSVFCSLITSSRDNSPGHHQHVPRSDSRCHRFYRDSRWAGSFVGRKIAQVRLSQVQGNRTHPSPSIVPVFVTSNRSTQIELCLRRIKRFKLS